MSNTGKQLSNPFSTGGGGVIFETRVQTAFVALMLTGGFVPCLPCWPIIKIKLQGKYEGYETDDLIVFVKSPTDGQERKLLAQVKHSISVTKGDKKFEEVIQAAWNDFNTPGIFKEGQDAIALITGPLTAIDTNNVRRVLELARESGDETDFMNKVQKAKFFSIAQRKKLQAFQIHLKNANNGEEVSDYKLWKFLKSFHLLGYDLDIASGVTLSLLHSCIGCYSQSDADYLWLQVLNKVQSADFNAGTITMDSLPIDLKDAFEQKVVETIPADLKEMPSDQAEIDWSQDRYALELAISNLMGSWKEDG